MATVSPNEPPTLSQARAEIEAMLDEEAGRLEQRRHDVARARELVATLSGVSAQAAQGALIPLPTEIAAGTVSQLLRDCTGEQRNLVRVMDEGPALDSEAVRYAQERILAGHLHRTIYPTDPLGLPASLQWVRSWAAVGEVQRVLATTPTEYAVFGTDAVVAQARWGDLDSGYVLSRDRLIIDLHIAFFDVLWDLAQPVSVVLGDTKDDARLLELLALGLKDEGIARLLGLGLRTVRRRIAALMAVHGVATRYQLGLAIGARQPQPRR